MDIDQILEHMSDGFLAVDHEWRITSANRRAEMLLLRRATDLVGQLLWQAIPDMAGSPAEAEIRLTSTGRVARRVEHFSPSRYTWLEALVVPGERETMLFMQNVSDRARAMETEAVRAVVRRILMDAPVSILITRGPEHRYDLVNARARELVGGRDIEGRTVRNAFPELEGTGYLELLDEVYRTGVPYTGKNAPVVYDRFGAGEPYEGIFDFTYQPLLEPDGRVWGIMITAVEVTEYIRERQRLEAERAP